MTSIHSTSQSSPVVNSSRSYSLLEGFQGGKEAFFDMLYSDDQEKTDAELVRWFMHELREDVRLRVEQIDQIHQIKTTPEWTVGFLSGYVTTYMEYMHQGMHQDVVESAYTDEQLYFMECERSA